MILIGIDPGVNTGFAVSQEGVITELLTLTFWETIDKINSHIKWSDQQIRIYIEDPNVNKPVFIKKGANARGYMRIAQNVGSNKRDAQLIIEYCQLKNIPLYQASPIKGPYHKLDSDTFNKITGCKGRTSQHERDACMLIWGRRN